ncbi:MAG: arsenite methyltransferase [Planctomycetota bacterium]
MKSKQTKTDPESTRRTVREAYARIAGGKTDGCCASSCCGASPDAMAKALGYKSEELGELPEGANMGLSCGNPTALAALEPGEVVLDLGSGGGFDVFIAAEKVAPSGRAIGVDMTPEMIEKARQNAAAFRDRTGLDNVEFRLGEIEHIPAPDNSVDVVISNCVINLSPDKREIWREMFRVLKPGGRVAVSDLALLRPLPDALRKSVEALVGCVAGAVLKNETESMAREAGFADVTLRDKPGVIESMTRWNDPLHDALVELLPTGAKLADYATSLDISAVKPKRT